MSTPPATLVRHWCPVHGFVEPDTFGTCPRRTSRSERTRWGVTYIGGWCGERPATVEYARSSQPDVVVDRGQDGAERDDPIVRPAT